MREKDVHNLIEQQNPEAKQRIWNKISSQIDVAPVPYVIPCKKVFPRKKIGMLSALAAVLVCIITLSVVLPLTLGDDAPDTWYCNQEEYTTEVIGQTLKERFALHGSNLLYVDWYDVAEDVVTECARLKEDQSRIVYLEEFFAHAETGEFLTLSITDKRIRVDKFTTFYNGNSVTEVGKVSVRWITTNIETLAMFEYDNHIYYLRLDVVNGQDRLTEIIEGMLQ